MSILLQCLPPTLFLLLSGCVHPQKKKRGLSAQVGEKSKFEKTWNLHWPLPWRERKLMFLRENSGVGLCRRLGGGWSLLHPLMEWIIESRPNSVSQARKPLFSSKKCSGNDEVRERKWEQQRVREVGGERKSWAPSGGESRYWKAIKLAFSRIDWKWRGLLKPRDKRTIVCFWPPYVALFSPSCCPPWGGAPYPVCLNTPGPKREVSEGFSTSWIDPSLSTTGTLFSFLTTQK